LNILPGGNKFINWLYRYLKVNFTEARSSIYYFLSSVKRRSFFSLKIVLCQKRHLVWREYCTVPVRTVSVVDPSLNKWHNLNFLVQTNARRNLCYLTFCFTNQLCRTNFSIKISRKKLPKHAFRSGFVYWSGTWSGPKSFGSTILLTVLYHYPTVHLTFDRRFTLDEEKALDFCCFCSGWISMSSLLFLACSKLPHKTSSWM
jgi:hypothetical protein